MRCAPAVRRQGDKGWAGKEGVCLRPTQSQTSKDSPQMPVLALSLESRGFDAKSLCSNCHIGMCESREQSEGKGGVRLGEEEQYTEVYPELATAS